ncbi:MAG: hypothetical protein Q9170_008193 [Blastenia crenularia]
MQVSLMTVTVTIGVLALQGAFCEHIKLLKEAVSRLQRDYEARWDTVEVRTAQELERCDALIIPGGESTTVSLVAARSNLLEPLREFVKYTLAIFVTATLLTSGMKKSANRTKKGGQDLIGGLDVRVNRNYFGRQTESFEADLDLPFLKASASEEAAAFRGIFIRAPVVEKILPSMAGEQKEEASRNRTVTAPGKDQSTGGSLAWPVEIMATLLGRSRRLAEKVEVAGLSEDIGDIIAVRQRNVFGTSFHPELTPDARIHMWWLRQVLESQQ